MCMQNCVERGLYRLQNQKKGGTVLPLFVANPGTPEMMLQTGQILPGSTPRATDIPAAPNGGYFACPDSADSTDRDRRAGSECPRSGPPRTSPAARPRKRDEREMPGACGHRPLCWTHGNFPELGKFPAFPGSSPPSDTQGLPTELPVSYRQNSAGGLSLSMVRGSDICVDRRVGWFKGAGGRLAALREDPGRACLAWGRACWW